MAAGRERIRVVSRVNYRQSSDLPPEGGGAVGLRGWFADRPQLPYLLPFMAFVALMMPATFGDFGGIPWKALWHAYHPLIYAAKTVAAAVLLWWLWDYYTPVRWSYLPLGVVVGLAGTVMWIGTEYFCQRVGLSRRFDPGNFSNYYNPDHELPSAALRWMYLVIRVAGPTLVVPVMEELFFRDFLMRALVRGARFQDVAVGTFTWFSLIGMSLLFGLNHGAMWPAGIVYGLLMGIVLVRTKSLGACIVAHGTTNFTLYIYVIYTGDWQFM
jgi:uncharacterized protein